MTAPAIDPHPTPMGMFERYPEGHERHGQRVARKRICACGEKFYQGQLSPAWLDRMPGSRSKLLVDQASTIEKDGTVWLPSQCPHCERRELNAPPPKKETQ